ncbi:MAG: ROK family protein [Rhizobacter sp.]|nr:ROK family protein [Chlorobiales bacterium]
MENFSIGVDLGGTNIKFASVSASGKIILEHRVPTEADKGPVRVIENMMTGILYLLSLNADAENAERLLGIGVGVPGVVSLDGGTLSYPPNLPGWQVVRLGDILKEKLFMAKKLSMPVFIENDANVAALGEDKFGAGRNLKTFLMITLGTGIGGGIIVDDKIFRGAHGAAGEIGHITVKYDGDAPANTGIRGSLESFIGQRQITEYTKKLLAKHPESKLHAMCGNDLSKLEPKLITEAAQRGDHTAIDVWSYVADVLGAGLGSVVSVLDIRKIVIGGGVAGAGDFVLKPALEQLKRYTLRSMHEGLQLIPAQLGNSAGVMGAAAQCI